MSVLRTSGLQILWQNAWTVTWSNNWNSSIWCIFLNIVCNCNIVQTLLRQFNYNYTFEQGKHATKMHRLFFEKMLCLIFYAPENVPAHLLCLQIFHLLRLNLNELLQWFAWKIFWVSIQLLHLWLVSDWDLHENFLTSTAHSGTIGISSRFHLTSTEKWENLEVTCSAVYICGIACSSNL